MTEKEKKIEAKKQFDEIRSVRLEYTEREGNGLGDRPLMKNYLLTDKH